MVQTATSIRTCLARSLAALALLCPHALLANPVAAPPPNALILFGAHWCAPCTGELRDLGTIFVRLGLLTGDPKPQLVLAWIDRPVAPSTVARALATAHDPPRVVIAAPAAASAWAEAQMAAAHGLPFAAMTDRTGTICAVRAGAVQAATIADLWANCHRQPE